LEICSVSGCERVAYGKKEYCQMHYSRFMRNGDPLVRYKTTKKVCLNCGKEFDAKNKCSNTKYCNPQCGHELWYSQSIEKSRKIKKCLHCGGEFNAVTYLYASQYCSASCRGKQNAINRVRGAICRQCGIDFNTPNKHLNTCPSCAKENMLNKVKRRNKHIRYLRRGAAGPHHSDSDWQRLLHRYNGKCAYCGERTALHKDHIIPISKGGTDSMGNILPACRECNLSKSDKFIVEWKQWKKVKENDSRTEAEAE